MAEPPIYLERELKLTALARQGFSDKLTTGELLLVHNSVRPGPPTPLSIKETKKRSSTPYTVRAGMLRWLVNERDAAILIDPNGIFVINTLIEEQIDLSDCKLAFNLSFDTTLLAKGLLATSASFKGIWIVRSQVRGEVNMSSSTVTGNCIFQDSKYAEDLNFIGAQIAGDLDLQSSQIYGLVNANGVKTGGSVYLNGACCLHTPVSVSLDVATIDGELYIGHGFEASGIVRAPHLHVGQDVHAAGARFNGNHRPPDNPDSDPASLLFMSVNVEGLADFDKATFAALAALGYAQVKERAYFREAQFAGKGEVLNLDAALIGDDLTLARIDTAGFVSMTSGSVKGNIDLTGATLNGARFADVSVGKSFYWRQLPHATDLDLNGSTLGNLEDDKQSWPSQDGLFLAGTTYSSLQKLSEDRSENVRLRIEWLKRRKAAATNPQPWHQLAATLEASGDKVGAKHVLFVYSRMQAHRGGWWRQPGSWMYDKIQEEPLRIIVPVSGFWALGAVVFWRAQRMAKMAPTDRTTLERFNAGESISNYPRFHPVAYALENVLPVIKLGQDAAWAPNPALPASSALHGWRRFLPQIEYRWLTRLRWTLILAGWVMALILAGAIGSRFK